MPGGDVASQGHTIDEALANLAEAVELYLKGVDDPVRQPRCHSAGYHVQTACSVSPALSDLLVRNVSERWSRSASSTRGPNRRRLSIHYLKKTLQFAETEIGPTVRIALL